MFREVRVYEIKEVLRLWLRGEGLRSIERLSSVDRKTVRRYVAAAVDAGLDRSGGEGQLNDLLLGVVCEAVRPHRPDGHGAAWAVLAANHDQLKAWVVTEGLTAVKAHELLGRQGRRRARAHAAPIRPGGPRCGPICPHRHGARRRRRAGR